MAGTISRAQFLRGDFKNQHAPLRPPWALSEQQFIDTCTQCAECIDSCPENILFKAAGNYPEVNFTHGECTFCYQCVESCNDAALIGSSNSTPWTLQAEITDQCLVFKGVHCMICREQCEAEAISFIPKVALPPYPVLNPLLCTGCGACLQPCPNQSIHFSYQSIKEPMQGSHTKETAI